jgi:signal transduction histidine kinase
MNDLSLLAMRAWSGSSEEGILVTDREGSIALINSRLQELLRLRTTPRTVPGLLRQIESKMPELDSLFIAPNPAYHAQWGTMRVQLFPPRRLIWQRIPLMDSGHLVGSLVIFRNTVAQGQLDVAKQSFLSMISHDLRTPLSTILGFAELLYNNRGKLSDDEQAEFLEHIIENANDLSRYTQIALDIMYLEANLQNFEAESVFLSRFVKHWLADALHRFPAERIRFQNGTVGDPLAQISPSALHRILYILAEFALAESPANEQIKLHLNYDSSQAHIVVQHHAPGLSADDATMLFQLMNPRDLTDVGRPHLHRMQLYVACLLAERQQGYLALSDQGGQQYQLDLAVPLTPVS